MENTENIIVPKITNSKTKEYIQAYNKKRYQSNRDKLLAQSKTKYICECCHIEIYKNYKTKHEKSKKHQSLMNNVINQIELKDQEVHQI